MNSANPNTLDDIRTKFTESGVWHICGFFSHQQIDQLAIECARLKQTQKQMAFNNLRTGLRTNLSGAHVVDRIDPVIDISPVFNELNNNQRLRDLVEHILQQPAQVMKEKLIYKAPGTSGFGLHRDEPYYRCVGAKGSEIISVVIAVDDMSAESGPIFFYPELRLQKTHAPATESRDVADEETRGLTPQTYLLNRGDILLFDGLIPHCSDYNRSRNQRRTYTITYVPARYKKARSIYYNQRLIEQETERGHFIDGQCVFD